MQSYGYTSSIDVDEPEQSDHDADVKISPGSAITTRLQPSDEMIWSSLHVVLRGSLTMFRFKCAHCDEWHVGMPALDTREPMPVAAMTERERETRCIGSSDAFIVDRKDYYVRGCLEIPVRGLPEGFSWGVWVSLSEASFSTYLESYEIPNRSHLGPFFGWLVSVLPYDEPTFGLKTRVHLRDDGIRPFVEVEPTDHPLAIEQRDGMALKRLEQIYARCLHVAPPH